jgi:hypothetical protein
MEYIVLNYKQNPQTKIKAEDIPSTIPANALSELLKNDADPYYSVEAIDFPVIGNTHIYGVQGSYEKGYFESIEKDLKKKPIPGSKNGHSYSDKPSNDLFLVGMKIEETAKGSGTAYFKNYIPPKDFNGGDNYGLIRDAKLGLLQFSLVSRPVYDDKELETTGKYKIIGTNGGNRNDAVEEGAMKQTVNSIQVTDFGLMRDLIKNNQVTLENIDGNIIQNGKVSRPALRQIVSRADCENKAEISELISMIDKTKHGGKPVDVTEISVAVKNGALSVDDIAKNCGFVIRNSDDDVNAKIVENMKKKLGDKPEEKLDTILAENSANTEAIVKNKVIAAYGQPKTKNGDVEADNPAYVYALDKCKGKNSAEVDALLTSLKDDAVMKMIASKNADMDTTAIVIGSHAKTGVSKNNIDGIPVIGG